MTYVVVYDVAEPKRLRRVAKACLDYGVRVEKSVFECDLGREDFERFWRRLNYEIEEAEDSLVAYPVCGSCLEGVRASGVAVRERPEVWDAECFVA